MIGLSTSWLTERTDISGAEVIEEITSLGFRAIELEYRVSETLFREMRPYIQREGVKVVSVHNFFPRPDGIPPSKASGDLFLLSSPDEEERERAVKGTIRTLERAHDLGALAVVLHLGKVEMDADYSRLKGFFRGGRLGSPEGRAFLEAKLRERRERRQPYLDSVLRSLDRLNTEAEGWGLILGVENRFHYHEIPDLDELALILDRFSGGSIRYWHDLGHAYVQERLCLLEDGALPGAYRSVLAGVHIHDARGTDDHWAPGSGEIDFRAMKKSLGSAPIKILEVHKKSSRDEILKAWITLEEVGLISPSDFDAGERVCYKAANQDRPR